MLRAVQADDIETFAAKEGAGAFAGTFAAMRDLSRIAGYVFDAREPGSGKCFDWSLLDGLERDGKLLFWRAAFMKETYRRQSGECGLTALM